MRIRIATGDDAQAVEQIRVRGWQAAYRNVFPGEELDAMDVNWSRWRRQLETPPAGWTTFVAENGGRLFGFVSVGPSRDERKIGELYAIYVDPGAWSTCVGRSLIARAEEQLAQDYDEATLWVLDANPRARRFYELAGWQPDGGAKTEAWLGVTALEVRYRKRFTSSRSRS